MIIALVFFGFLLISVSAEFSSFTEMAIKQFI